ncbi:STN domain-containing protein [Puia sp. P3]|uniref:STN domain-containing protein n=1 Tax=Puia sp. P3 TaxID=3423952 RepID=UPI003D66A1E2
MTKLAIILIVCFTLPAAASSYGQGQISLRLDNVTIKDVLRAIEDQGSFRFVYKTSVLSKGQQRTSVTVDHAPLTEVLALILKNSPLTWRKINDRLYVIMDSVATQKQAIPPITGKITDGNGNALSGVTIRGKRLRQRHQLERRRQLHADHHKRGPHTRIQSHRLRTPGTPRQRQQDSLRLHATPQ